MGGPVSGLTKYKFLLKVDKGKVATAHGYRGGSRPPPLQKVIDFYSGFRKKNPGIHFNSGFREKNTGGEILRNPGIYFYCGFRKNFRYTLL